MRLIVKLVIALHIAYACVWPRSSTDHWPMIDRLRSCAFWRRSLALTMRSTAGAVPRVSFSGLPCSILRSVSTQRVRRSLAQGTRCWTIYHVVSFSRTHANMFEFVNTFTRPIISECSERVRIHFMKKNLFLGSCPKLPAFQSYWRREWNSLKKCIGKCIECNIKTFGIPQKCITKLISRFSIMFVDTSRMIFNYVFALGNVINNDRVYAWSNESEAKYKQRCLIEYETY